MAQNEELASLTRAVLRSAKYQHVSPAFIRRIGAQQLTTRQTVRAAIKATKNKLHQVGGAYFDARLNYDEAIGMLRAAADAGDISQACRELMRSHASTRERLEILEEFYVTTLADLPSIRTVIDVACGLNPLALPWMPFDSSVQYFAYDIYGDMIALLQDFLQLMDNQGRAEVRDVVGDPPTQVADLALILKTLPCLGQIDKAAVPGLLNALQARYLLISFPARSLGGRRKGMVENYETQFQAWTEGRGWRIKRFEFASELAFLVQTV